MAITLENPAAFYPLNSFAELEAPVARITVSTTRFGIIEVEEDLIITLPEGIIGFDQCKRFVIVQHDDLSMFRWLQSLDIAAIAFPIIDPNEFREVYTPIVSDADVRMLGLTAEMRPLLFAIVTIPAGNPRGMTANLLGPIVVNPETRSGKQIIVPDQGYSTRHVILEEMEKLPPRIGKR